MGWAERLAFARMRAATFFAGRAIARSAARAVRHAPPPATGPLRVMMLASQPEGHAATRHRLLMWADRLRREGHTVETFLPAGGDEGERLFRWDTPSVRAGYHAVALASRRRAVAAAPAFDVAVVHMNDVPAWEYGRPFVAEALVRTAGRVLLDLDDLPVVRGESAPGPRARRLAGTVDGLILGNRELASWFPGRPSWVVPTCVDVDAWPARDPASRSGPPLLGWIGTAGRLASLEALAPVLAAACARHGARVRVICDAAPTLPGVPVEFVPWRAGSEPENLADVDVGLAPLEDTPVARCKCGLKAIEHAASASAVVASPVGALRDIVAHGETGFLASGAAEWAAALDELLGDPARRARMGATARAMAASRWSPAAHASEFERALRGGNSPPAPREPGSRR
jgi:glycosyltransferase involved in cell wall biosynthesis